MARLFVAPLATLHALAVCQEQPHLIAAAGTQRGVVSFDVRSLKQAQRSHLNKWDITSVSFLQRSPGHCLAAGLDQEVTIAPWEGSKFEVRDVATQLKVSAKSGGLARECEGYCSWRALCV